MLWRPLTSPIGCWLLECVHRLHSTSQNTHTHTRPLINREKGT
jgi:hypothetical protein